MAGSLALVLGVFFLVVWALRRASPNASAALPAEVFEVLGRAPWPTASRRMMLRCGNKLLLVSRACRDTKTLTEITDPAEVERLVELVPAGPSGGAAAAFRQVFRQKEDAMREQGQCSNAKSEVRSRVQSRCRALVFPIPYSVFRPRRSGLRRLMLAAGVLSALGRHGLRR